MIAIGSFPLTLSFFVFAFVEVTVRIGCPSLAMRFAGFQLAHILSSILECVISDSDLSGSHQAYGSKKEGDIDAFLHCLFMFCGQRYDFPRERPPFHDTFLPETTSIKLSLHK